MKTENNNYSEEVAFFRQHTVAFKKTKAEEWKELKERLEKNKKSHRKLYAALYYAAGIAAAIILISTFVRTKVHTSGAGEQLFCELPDGSKVQLNSESRLTYYPIEWYFSRKVKLEGEAFFEVKKGSKFAVISTNGTTQVLGTSFNVYARSDAYKVACVTGKVQVNTQGKSATILPGEAVVWNKNTKTIIKTEKEQESLLAWRKHRLLFKGKPLREVFDALERQYGVYIAYYPNGEKYYYSGNISLDNTIEENLSIVCKPFEKNWQQEKQREKRKLYIIN